MSDSAFHSDRLLELAGAVCNRIATEDDCAELNAILLTDEQARNRYAEYCWLHVALRLRLRARRAANRAHRQINSHFVGASSEDCVTSPITIPPVAPSRFSFHSFQDAFGYVSTGWPIAYLIATFVVSVGITIAAVTHISDPGKPAKTSATASDTPAPDLPSPAVSVVGRITGMSDCVFENSGHDNRKSEIGKLKSAIALGDRFAIRSGLLEITYDTGAKVILQGPVTYEVESKNGGFVLIGKLTGKVENKAATGFEVRTPTATVTDLGTEFGVEVDKGGHTTSHVFRGSVRVRLIGDNTKASQETVIVANQSVQTHEKGTGKDRVYWMVTRTSVDPRNFVRKIVTVEKTLDLLSVVAGGYGDVSRRQRGIDPTTGVDVSEFNSQVHSDNGRYHLVPWHAFIDGVFCPNGKNGPVIVDSAGHLFKDIPVTGGDAVCPIWARAADIPLTELGNRDCWIYVLPKKAVEPFMPKHGGLLCMHPNVGITFNLQAISEAYHGMTLLRFRAFGGLGDRRVREPDYPPGLAEIWVLVDGNVQFHRTHVQPQDGPIPIDVALHPSDRFLTIIVGDGDGHAGGDWVILGEPSLDMILR